MVFVFFLRLGAVVELEAYRCDDLKAVIKATVLAGFRQIMLGCSHRQSIIKKMIMPMRCRRLGYMHCQEANLGTSRIGSHRIDRTRLLFGARQSMKIGQYIRSWESKVVEMIQLIAFAHYPD